MYLISNVQILQVFLPKLVYYFDKTDYKSEYFAFYQVIIVFLFRTLFDNAFSHTSHMQISTKNESQQCGTHLA